MAIEACLARSYPNKCLAVEADGLILGRADAEDNDLACRMVHHGVIECGARVQTGSEPMNQVLIALGPIGIEVRADDIVRLVVDSEEEIPEGLVYQAGRVRQR